MLDLHFHSEPKTGTPPACVSKRDLQAHLQTKIAQHKTTEKAINRKVDHYMTIHTQH